MTGIINILGDTGYGGTEACDESNLGRVRLKECLELGKLRSALYECIFKYLRASGWIPPIHRIAIGIQVFVQRGWVLGIPVFRIAGHEPTCGGIVVSGAEVVEARSESNCSPR